MATPVQISEVAKHFIIAAIWADCPEGTHPRSTNASEREAFNLCKAFIDKHNDLFNQAMERAKDGYGSHPDAGSAEAAFGHDLYLTIRGHGCGFGDRDELDGDSLGAALTKACESCYCEATFYRGWLYLDGWRVEKKVY